MKFQLKKRTIIILCILLLLLITNPTRSDFAAFLGFSPKDKYYLEDVKKKNNFLLFSIYVDDNTSTGTYLGVLKNFIRVSKDN